MTLEGFFFVLQLMLKEKTQVSVPRRKRSSKRMVTVDSKNQGAGIQIVEEIKLAKTLVADTKKEEAKEKAKEGKNLSHKKVMSWGYCGVEVAERDCSSVDNATWVDAGPKRGGRDHVV